ncbi:MAG: RecX family transcriptional regulator [candidate division WOR-3 bacterium]
MKISKIEVQKRNKKRSNIYLNGEYRLALDNEIILKYDLKEGDEIDDVQLKGLLFAEQKQRLKQRAYKLLRYRNRSVAELKERLIKLGYEPDLIDAVLYELKTEGILDDERFAQNFVDNYTNLKPRGNIFIIKELRKRKIDEQHIQELVKERDEIPLIKKMIEKRYGKFDKKDFRQKGKIFRYLISKGFTPQSIAQVLGEDYE